MPPSGKDKIREQSQEELARIAEVSMRIREALRSALPAPPEQFFTMMVPAKVLNFSVCSIFLRSTAVPGLGGLYGTWLPHRITQRVLIPRETQQLSSPRDPSNSLRPFYATICRLYLAFNLVPPAGPLLGVTPLLSASSAPLVSPQFPTRSRLRIPIFSSHCRSHRRRR